MRSPFSRTALALTCCLLTFASRHLAWFQTSPPKGRDEIASVAYALTRTKTYLDGLGKALVDEYKEVPKKIDANRKIIRDTLDTLRDEVGAPLTDFEAAEEKRVADLQQRLNRIAELGNLPANSPGATAEQLTVWLAELEGTAIDESWQERQTEAGVAKEAATIKVKQALSARQNTKPSKSSWSGCAKRAGQARPRGT